MLVLGLIELGTHRLAISEYFQHYRPPHPRLVDRYRSENCYGNINLAICQFNASYVTIVHTIHIHNTSGSAAATATVSQIEGETLSL